ncbi:hypothetical protein Tco_0647148 [Tanacetum coccineum]
MNNLETLHNAETLNEMDSKTALSVIQMQGSKRLAIIGYKFQENETSSGIVSDEENDKHKWKHITFTCHKIQESHLKNPFQTSRHWNRNLKKALSEKPCICIIPYDTSDPGKTDLALEGKRPWTLDNEMPYSANHDECVLEYLSRLNPRASAQNKDAKSHKTTNEDNMPVLVLQQNDLLIITVQNSNPRPNNGTVKFKAGSKSCSLSKQDSYITTRVGITIPPSYSNAEDNR